MEHQESMSKLVAKIVSHMNLISSIQPGLEAGPPDSKLAVAWVIRGELLKTGNVIAELMRELHHIEGDIKPELKEVDSIRLVKK